MAVWGVILRDYFGSDAQLMVLLNRTRREEVRHLAELARLPGVAQDAVDDLRARNAETTPLPVALPLHTRYVLVSDAGFAQFTTWAKRRPELSRCYPGATGVVTLSRVGFKADRNQALVCAGLTVSTNAGGGRCIMLLRKPAGPWQVTDWVNTWSQ
jgi:hypothetical protein